MSSIDFESLKKAIKAELFSDDQVAALKDAAAKNYFRSEQVARLLDLFQFDDSRIEAALICYPKVLDLEDFNVVYSHLNFDSSKDELREKIRKLESGSEER